MGEIKFDVTRMTEVYNRLDEIQQQLMESTTTNNDTISEIETNINGDEVKTILTKYREKSEEVKTETVENINILSAYLRNQIAKYSSTEQAATETLADVQNILAGLDF